MRQDELGWMGGIVGLSEVRDQTKSITISSSLDLLVVTQFSGVIFFPVVFILSPVFFFVCALNVKQLMLTALVPQ